MKKIRSLLKRAKGGIVTTGAIAGSALISAQAHAAFAVPAAVTTAFDDLGDAWTTIEGKMWVVAVPVVIGFILLKWFKRGSNKAT
jgi:hypothetical protein